MRKMIVIATGAAGKEKKNQILNTQNLIPKDLNE